MMYIHERIFWQRHEWISSDTNWLTDTFVRVCVVTSLALSYNEQQLDHHSKVERRNSCRINTGLDSYHYHRIIIISITQYTRSTVTKIHQNKFLPFLFLLNFATQKQKLLKRNQDSTALNPSLSLLHLLDQTFILLITVIIIIIIFLLRRQEHSSSI